MPSRLVARLALVNVTAVLSLSLPYFALRGGTGDSTPVLARAHYGLLAVVAWMFIGLCAYWNLLGFQY